MEKLFEAILQRHPDYEIVDLRFTINVSEENFASVEEFLENLASAVRNSQPFDPEDFSN